MFSSVFGAEAANRADPALLGRLLQLGEVLDAELVVEPAGRLRAQARHPGHLDQGRRELRLQLVRRGDAPGLDQRVDLLRERLADRGQLGQPALLGELLDRDRALARRCGPPPGRRAPGSGPPRRARRGSRAPAGRRRSRRFAYQTTYCPLKAPRDGFPILGRLALAVPESPKGRRAATATPATETITPGSSCRPTTRPRTSSGSSAPCSSSCPTSRPDPGRRRQLARRHRRDRRPAGGVRATSVAVLHRPRKEGLGPAYLAGFRVALDAGAELIIEMDADFSHDPAYLPGLLEAAEHADLVIGSRYVPGGGVTDWGPMRRLISRGGSAYARLVLGLAGPGPDRRLQVLPPRGARGDRPRHDRGARLRLPGRDDLPRDQGRVPGGRDPDRLPGPRRRAPRR